MPTSLNKKSAYEEMIKGLWRDNPVFIQVLGMCPMLAVTNSAVNAVVMGFATFFVLVVSSFLVASFTPWIPKQVRISLYVIIIATFVTVVDYTILALMPAVHKELGAFIPLIVANCMILGRQEAFASRYGVRLAVSDAVGMSLGFMFALFVLGAVREILGVGQLFGIDLFGANFEPWVIMILPPGGFLTLGLILLFFNWLTEKRKQFLVKVAIAERSEI
ncbi:electron transport complex subunit RsxE [Solemya pervernicosa gill symbiont]|uniref:Ion-translocating oxidoreductase complex subunit E n=2 Tax=Gammaproteobacteria incertae sedis TaxID=118884 RepID=A0A1T2L2W1_9GAMM|nr:electron transport complex subunit RsxE [Candidatus Reidiella endopervernicosa]OOZ39412.1 electron transport complex subunit RsxE [Solemya pervernicosa gill symbiont]QKQ26933.1 electron transport complex subunit RsxE [Candidatus Reidiella endopervernicosa]